jgi:hypothetical protein
MGRLSACLRLHHTLCEERVVDRDSRDLMGPLNLYIADACDVDSHSRTRKPFERVFNTRAVNRSSSMPSISTGNPACQAPQPSAPGARKKPRKAKVRGPSI